MSLWRIEYRTSLPIRYSEATANKIIPSIKVNASIRTMIQASRIDIKSTPSKQYSQQGQDDQARHNPLQVDISQKLSSWKLFSLLSHPTENSKAQAQTEWQTYHRIKIIGGKIGTGTTDYPVPRSCCALRPHELVPRGGELFHQIDILAGWYRCWLPNLLTPAR